MSIDATKNTELMQRGGQRNAASLIAMATLALTGCDSDDMLGGAAPADPAPPTGFEGEVSASSGGTFSSLDGGFTVTINPGALSADTTITIRQLDQSAPAMGTLADAGPAYALDLGDVEVSEAMKIEITTDAQRAAGAVVEAAREGDDGWERAPSNFFRASEQIVVALSEQDGVYKSVTRTLQAETGDGVERGRVLFLEESFGNEAFFGGVLGLHEVLNNLAPVDAVGAGVQVDITRVPQSIADVLTGNDFAGKQAALEDPAVTRALLKAGAVVGVKAVFENEDDDLLSSAGITCALCHNNVTPTEFELSAGELTPLPIGELTNDGVPNTTMDAGLILSLTPFAQSAGPETVESLQSFGPGNFDVRALPDNPLEDNVANPTNVPALWNFVDLTEQGYTFNWDGLFVTEDGPERALASQAEAVYDLVMHANGAFGTDIGTVPPQLAVAPPQELLNALAQAEADAPGNVITEQALLDVQTYQRSIVSPPPGGFDEALAEEGFMVFNGERARCVNCHQTAEFTGPVVSGNITIDGPEGDLAGGIKTPGLRGIRMTAPYFHDGSAETLEDMVQVYSGRVVDALEQDEIDALVEYLKSL